MRLLDQVAQTKTPFLVRIPGVPKICKLFGAAELSPLLIETPIRYVCESPVTRLCAEIGGDFDTMSRCLDLMRVPAPQMWMEWDETERLSIARGYRTSADGGAHRAGMLVQASESGRSGSIQTCWNSQDAEGAIDVAPVVIRFDLDDPTYSRGGGESCIDLSRVADSKLSAVLSHLRFEVRPDWVSYYRRQSPRALHQTLIQCALPFGLDFNLLMALTLLLDADAGPFRHHAVDRSGVNRRRMAARRPALLDHIELISVLGRRNQLHCLDHEQHHVRRMHVVRGHLVRRGDRVFWRRAHWRGSIEAGVVSTRTVTLRRSA